MLAVCGVMQLPVVHRVVASTLNLEAASLVGCRCLHVPV